MIIGLDTLPDHGAAHYQINFRRDMFIATGRARDLLVNAFSKLPGLRSVGLRDYDGNGRYREGEKAKWKSYGWSLGDPCQHPHSRPRYAPPDTLLPLLLFVLSEASITPTNLEAFLRRAKMPDRAFDLSCLPSDVMPVLSGLKTLLLSLEADRVVHGGDTGHKHLRGFLQHTPLLEHLRLNFTSMPITSSDVGSEGLLRWLSIPSGSAGKVEPAPIPLHHLATLDLGMLNVRPGTLLRVVSKFVNLKSLSLWKVTLQCSDHHDNGNDSCVWSQFLPKLGKAFQSPKDVSRIMIGFAVETNTATRAAHYGPADVQFASKVLVDANGEKKFEDPESKVSYRKCVGSSVQEWFEDLSNKAFVEQPEESDRSYDSEDGEDDDDEDEGVEMSEESVSGNDGDGE